MSEYAYDDIYDGGIWDYEIKDVFWDDEEEEEDYIGCGRLDDEEREEFDD